MKIDFLAIETHHIDHALAIWEHIKDKGKFYAPRITKQVIAHKADYRHIAMSENPIAVFCYKDLRKVNSIGRKNIVFGEHGIGLTFMPPHPSYAGSTIGKENVRLLLCQNQHVVDAYNRVLPKTERAVIGIPKMDKWAKRKFKVNKESPTVAISFHWDGMAHNETRSAYPFYINDLAMLARQFKVIGHGHPRIIKQLIPLYEKAKIEVVEDFDEVLERADVYACDCGSSPFEFAFTGKPIIFMNCPYYDEIKGKKRGYNFRFWQYADIGPEVNNVKEMTLAIHKSFDRHYNAKRKMAVKDIFHYLDGRCGRRAARIIEKTFKFNKGRSNNRLRN